MKIFISWSGERSKYIAESIRLWIPKVIQAVKLWMSNEDIESGKRWSSEIMQELENSKFGIICITPENQLNPWLMFESGALSKTLDQTYVCPIIYDMMPSEISSPLSQFQARNVDKEGIFKLIKTINNALDKNSIKEEELEEIFNVWWPQLESKINNCPPYEGIKIKERTPDDILKELVDNTREQLRREELRLEKNKRLDEKIDFLIEYMENIKALPSMLNNLFSNNQKLIQNSNSLETNQNLQFKELNNIFDNDQINNLLRNIKEIKKTSEDFREGVLNKPEEEEE